jgi:hypothetical protein
MTQTSSTSVDLTANTTASVSDPHALQADAVLSGLQSHRDGLSGAEAADRLKSRWPKPASSPAEGRAVEAVFQALQ